MSVVGPIIVAAEPAKTAKSAAEPKMVAAPVSAVPALIPPEVAVDVMNNPAGTEVNKTVLNAA